MTLEVISTHPYYQQVAFGHAATDDEILTNQKLFETVFDGSPLSPESPCVNF